PHVRWCERRSLRRLRLLDYMTEERLDKMIGKHSVIFAILVCAATILLLPAAVRADDDENSPTTLLENKPITLHFDRTDFWEALKQTFESVGVSYIINPTKSNGVVTASFVKVPFRVALETILRTSSALTYRYENGIYSVVPKTDEPAIPVDPAPVPPELNF